MPFAAALIAALISLAVGPNAVLTAAPQSHDQVPGFYRLISASLRGDSGVLNQNIQSLSDDRTNLHCQPCCPFWSSQIRPDRIRASPVRIDCGN
jgi:hypothetical protein